MLKDKFAAVAEKPAMHKALGFLDGNIYPAVYAALALLSSFFGLEIPLFVLTALLIVFVCLFARDTRSLLVPVVFVMFGMSWKHTPQPPYYSDFLTQTYFYVVLGVLGALVLAAFVWRLIVWRGERNFFKDKSAYKWGLVALCAALLLNGIFFSGYVISDLFLGALFAFSFIGLYIFFFNTLETRKNLHMYAAYLLALACAVIFVQIVYILLFGDVIKDGSINKDFFVAGWGMSNNVGGYLAFFLPACFYLSVKVRRGWILYVLGFVFFGGIFFTQSRTAILVGGFAVVCMAVYLSVVRSPQRKFIRIFNIVCVAAVIVGAVVFWEKIADLFAVIFDRGFDDSDRFFIWESGLKNFLRAPVFGAGFYEPIAPDWSYGIENWLFPDMYHNLFIQMLAGCGIVGIAALVFHLVQFAVVIFKKGITVERLFCAAVALVILGTSLLDNHLFHVFPALIYSVMLLFSERAPVNEAPPAEASDRESGEPLPEPCSTETEDGQGCE